MNEARIKIDQVSRVFQSDSVKTVALNNISGSFCDGKMTALVGPSGSGKTTLLNLICGLDRPTEGRVSAFDKLLDECSEKELSEIRRKKIGLVFQASYLIEELRVSENIALPLHLNGWNRQDIKPRVGHLLDSLKMTDKVNSFPGELSQGQAQMIGVARALAHNPKLVVADEPTANLDLSSAERVIGLMKGFCEREGVTILTATHDIRLFHQFDVVWNLEDGCLKSVKE